MPNYDDLFTTQPAPQEEFNKDAWAAKKQAERKDVYLMIDTYAHEMSIDGGLFQGYLDVQARFDLYSVSNAILIAAQSCWPTSRPVTLTARPAPRCWGLSSAPVQSSGKLL